MFHNNKELRLSLILLSVATAILTFVAVTISIAAGVLVLLLGLIAITVHLATEYYRYRKLQKLSSDLDNLLISGTPLPIREYSEGELSILANQIQKMTLRLTESAEAIKADKVYLADSLTDISHQLRTPLTAMNLSSILAKFNRMRQEFNYPDSIRLEFLSDQYFFRSAGDCMILIYYDSSQEAFIPCCSNTELRIKAIQHSAPGIMRYRATSSSFVRDKYVSEYTKRRAQGVCQLCDQPAPFCDPNGIPYLETHHVIWLADGGPDSIENTVALCPNCHRKMHILNLDEDVQKLILLAANTDWC